VRVQILPEGLDMSVREMSLDYMEPRLPRDKTTIEQTNSYLEEMAHKAEQGGQSDWVRYYRGLLDIDKQNRFRISTVETETPLNTYLEEHKSEFFTTPYTGFVEFIRKMPL
jgi:hypothetical protein